MVLFEAVDINFTAEDILNGVPIMIRRGQFMSDFQIYYYDLGDEIISFAAYYESSTSGHLDQVTEIQQSFRTT